MGAYSALARAAMPLPEQVKVLFRTGAEGLIFDVAAAFARGAIWEDAARTTPASVDGPVGSIQDELLRYYASQGTSGSRPILRDAGAGHYWLDGDGTKTLATTLGSVPATPAGISGGAAFRYTGAPGSGVLRVFGPGGLNDSDGLWVISHILQNGNRSFITRASGTTESAAVGGISEGADVAMLGWRTDSVGVSVLANGLTASSAATTLVGTSQTVGIFRGADNVNLFQGRFYGGIVLDRQMTATERALVYAYLEEMLP